MSGHWFEDFFVGQEFRSSAMTITEASIIDFALKYDPQPFHLDRREAEKSIYGGLIASGWQMAAVTFGRFLSCHPFAHGASLGAPGVDKLEWLHPVRPGDSVHVVVTVLDIRPSGSKPDRGVVRMEFELLNHEGTVVLRNTAPLMVRRKA